MTVIIGTAPDAATRRTTPSVAPFGQSRRLRAACYRCHAGPEDRPFAEVHAGHSISYVSTGSFGYAAQGRRHDLVAGALLLGTPGCEYVCSHEHHGRGDTLACRKLCSH